MTIFSPPFVPLNKIIDLFGSLVVFLILQNPARRCSPRLSLSPSPFFPLPDFEVEICIPILYTLLLGNILSPPSTMRPCCGDIFLLFMPFQLFLHLFSLQACQFFSTTVTAPESEMHILFTRLFFFYSRRRNSSLRVIF